MTPQESRRRYRETHRELIRAQGRAYNAAHRAEAHARYLRERPERLAYAAARVAEQRESKRRYDLAYRPGWYAAHREEQQERVRRRRAKRRANGIHLVRQRDWTRLVARYAGQCAYCGRIPRVLVRDHVVPIIRGGHHAIGNLLPACGSCNSRKHDDTLTEWRARQRRAAA